MRTTPMAALAATLIAGAIAATPAAAQPATVTVDNKSFAPGDVSINAGEAVTWSFQESGHNIDIVQGPETARSGSGTMPSGSQFSHTFSQPGTYKFVCDYHSGMSGTVTVAKAAAPAPAPGSQPQPKPSGSTPQPTTGSGAAEPGQAPAAGPAGAPTAGAADGAAPTVQRVSLRRGTLRVRLSEAAKLTIRYRRVGASTKLAKKTVTGRKGINALRLGR